MSILTDTKDLLKRTSLTVPFDEFLTHVENNYPQIGKIKSYDPILIGYEAANFFLHTQTGDYVLKIFESDREPANIDSLVKVHTEAKKVEVPVPEIIRGGSGYLSEYDDFQTTVPYLITKRFNGENFEHSLPTLDEMILVCRYLAKLNTLDFEVTEAYDSWGNKNLLAEYEKNKTLHAAQEIKSVILDLEKIPLSAFSKGVIHGDLQTKHVFKNHEGDYCIIDFGCMSYDAKVIDLSTFLAWFCLFEENSKAHLQILLKMTEIYCETHQLSDLELESLPTLIRASYAAYYLKTSELISNGDHSDETAEWNKNASTMLKVTENLSY